VFLKENFKGVRLFINKTNVNKRFATCCRNALEESDAEHSKFIEVISREGLLNIYNCLWEGWFKEVPTHLESLNKFLMDACQTNEALSLKFIEHGADLKTSVDRAMENKDKFIESIDDIYRKRFFTIGKQIITIGQQRNPSILNTGVKNNANFLGAN